MPLKKVYYYHPNVQKTRNFDGSETYVNSADTHILYEQTVGYVGKRPKVKPYPLHPYSAYNDRLTFQFNDFRQYPDGRWRLIEGPSLARVPHSPVFDPAPNFDGVYNAAIDKLNDKARGDLDLSVDLAEAYKTAKMLDTAERVLSYTKTFAKRFGVMKLAAAHWLEYTYGVKPLLSSIFGLAEENLRVVYNKVARFHARATDNSWRPARVQINDIYGLEWYPVTSGTFKLSCTLGLDMTTDSFDMARFTSLNPVSLAWELMPYSFVVDWFINVGGYLRNAETALLYGGRFRTGYRTNLLAYSGQSKSFFDYTKNGITPGGYQYTDSQFKGSWVNRTVLSSYPLPTLPSFQAKLGSSRLLSTAALLAQQIGKTFPYSARTIWTLEMALKAQRKNGRLAVRG